VAERLAWPHECGVAVMDGAAKGDRLRGFPFGDKVLVFECGAAGMQGGREDQRIT